MLPINGNIILKEVKEKQKFQGIILPKQFAANQVMFAKIIALPKEKLNTPCLYVGQYVVMGASPIWEKKFKHKIYDEEYFIINEYAIFATIDSNEIDIEEELNK